jgi:hypothetical protein
MEGVLGYALKSRRVTHMPPDVAKKLGIDLSSRKEGELFKWFLACLLVGKPIQQEIAERAYARLVSAEPYNASRAASAASWKHEPFTDGVPLAYQAMFDDEQFARLKTGFIPQEMEDKWFIYYEEPHLFVLSPQLVRPRCLPARFKKGTERCRGDRGALFQRPCRGPWNGFRLSGTTA